MLSLIWTAEFKNGTLIQQFEDSEQKIEHAFKEVLDSQEDLLAFALFDISNKIWYVVDLITGVIYKSTEGQARLGVDEDMLREKTYKYRLIYFRRVVRTFGTDLKELDSPKIAYFLGFQYADENGRNRKKIIKIDDCGRMVIA